MEGNGSVYKQISLLDDLTLKSNSDANRDYEVTQFSSDSYCIDTERINLEKRYIGIVEETKKAFHQHW